MEGYFVEGQEVMHQGRKVKVLQAYADNMDYLVDAGRNDVYYVYEYELSAVTVLDTLVIEGRK